MNSPGLRFLGAALIVLLGVWAGLKMHSMRMHSAQNPPRAAVAVPAGMASAPDPNEPAAEISLPRAAVPSRMPEFALNDLSGRSTPISAWDGKSLMLNFWATWCAPCRQEIPLLKSLAAEWSDKDLKVIGIAVDHPDKVQEFAAQFKIDYPLLVGEQDALSVAAQFGMDSPAFPFTVFTDQKGEVVALFLGELHRPQAEFILSEVQSLNQGRILLPEARRRIEAGLQAIAEKHS
jgi:thiol-disulfide isomerase/thioredoxin